ncbi:MAG: hypothetical protein J5I93_02560 [Pirellulaceae bacterium]|nr:hypothetical protein [Pirellulaceae bacterium]
MRAATWQTWFVVWTIAASVSSGQTGVSWGQTGVSWGQTGVSWGQTGDAPPAVVLTAEATSARSPFEASNAARRSGRLPAGERMPMSLRNIDPTRTLEPPAASLPAASLPAASLRKAHSPRTGNSVPVPSLWSVSYLLGI